MKKNAIKVEFNVFAEHHAKFEQLAKQYDGAIGIMESIAIELEDQEDKVRKIIKEYRDLLEENKKEVWRVLKETGITTLPDHWKRQFDRLENRVRDIKSIRGIVSEVKSI
jgi:radical SAM superfamily enzyme